MRGGRFRGFVVLALLLFATAALAEEEILFVNGEAATLEASVVFAESSPLVPLREFGLLVGVAVVDATDGSLTLRWNGGLRSLHPAELPSVEGTRYVSLQWLVDLCGGDVRRVGRTTYVETEPASLNDFDASEERIVLRFDAFVPIEIVSTDEASIRLRFHHCSAPDGRRSVSLGAGPMTRAEVRSVGGSAIDLLITLRQEGALDLTRFEAADFFSATSRIGKVPRDESITVVDSGIKLHEANLASSSGTTRVAYLQVEDWRSRFRLRPAYVLDGTSSLAGMAVESNGMAAIGVGSELGFLVVEGAPISLRRDEALVLVSDAFGRLSDLRGTGAPFLSVEGAEIPLDGANRPLRYGEAVVYTPGYGEAMATGVPGGFTVLKLRNDRIVSVYQGSYIDRDPSATLIVASGEAYARFSHVSIGDDARLEVYVTSAEEPLSNAVTISSVLFRDGIALDDASGRSEASRGWSVVATDWHGGLVLLSIARNEWSAGATLGEVMDLLRAFEVPIEDAFALSDGRSDTLVLNREGVRELADGDLVAVGLVLVPLPE